MIFKTHKKTAREVARETYEVTFARPAGFVFRAGQYTQIAVPTLAHPDPKGRSRQFSLASSPNNSAEISVVFRNSLSGFKRTLIELPENAPVVVEEGAGSFLIPLSSAVPLVFVAGGVGIAPFMSFFRTVSKDTKISSPIFLLYGNQNPEAAAFRDELHEFAEYHEEFCMKEVHGPLAPELFAAHVAELSPATWFVVGPPGMVMTAVYGLEAAGVRPNSIVTESFYGY
jgi:ferredoxin-NADP reductase